MTTSAAQSYTASTSTTLNGTLAVNTAGARGQLHRAGGASRGGGAITLTGCNAANNVSFSATSTVDGAQRLAGHRRRRGAVSFAAAVGSTTAPTSRHGWLQRHHQPAGGDHLGAQSYTASTSTTLNGTLAVNTAGAGVSFTGPVLLPAGGPSR